VWAACSAARARVDSGSPDSHSTARVSPARLAEADEAPIDEHRARRMSGRVLRALAEGRQQLVVAAEELDGIGRLRRDGHGVVRRGRAIGHAAEDRGRRLPSIATRASGRRARGRRRSRAARGACRDRAQAVPDKARSQEGETVRARATAVRSRRFPQGHCHSGMGRGAAPRHAVPGRGEGNRRWRRSEDALAAHGSASGGGTVTGGV
jgi:hypothetical protein